MADTSPKGEDTAGTPPNVVSHLQKAGLGSLMGMGTAWVEAMSAMSAEMGDFIAERIKEDVKTQHEILNCRTVSDLREIQAQFMQKAIDQYQAETGKLVEIGTKAFAAPDKET